MFLMPVCFRWVTSSAGDDRAQENVVGKKYLEKNSAFYYLLCYEIAHLISTGRQ